MSQVSLIPKDRDYQKLSKATSGYLEIQSFRNADLNAGYFCNDCLYFIKDNQCAIVKSDGPDVNGEESGIIAPHGLCTLWVPMEGQTH
jgi:hypothetical protein